MTAKRRNVRMICGMGHNSNVYIADH